MNEHHFMHGSSQMPEIYIYIGHGYFNAFFTRIHKLLGNKVHCAFSSAYFTGPNIDAAVPPNPHVIPYEEGDMDEEDPLHQWYFPKTNDSNPPSRQSSDTYPEPSTKVTWSNNTKPLVTYPPQETFNFQLRMDLMYRNGECKSTPVVYKGANDNGLFHKISLKDRAKLDVYDSNLQLVDQPNFRTCLKLQSTTETRSVSVFH